MGTTSRVERLRNYLSGLHRSWYIGTAAAALAFLIGVGATATAVQTNLVPRAMNKIDEILNPEPQLDEVTVSWRTLETGLHTLFVSDPIHIGDIDTAGHGGGIAEANDTILFVSPQGQIGYFHLKEKTVDFYDLTVPMNIQAVMDSRFWMHPRINPNFFRVHDILLTEDQRHLYVSHHDYRDACVSVVISRIEIDLSADVPTFPNSDWERFATMEPCMDLAVIEASQWQYSGNMSGGRMIQYDESSILMGVGSLTWPYAEEVLAAGGQVDLAKMFLFDLETGERTLFAEGLRNPQGLAMDAQGGIWEVESGPQGGDELNFISQDKHYGFPNVSLGMGYASLGVPRTTIYSNPVQGRHEGYEAPSYAWMPSIAPSSAIAIDTEHAFELWENDLIVGSLRGKALFRVRTDGSEVIYAEPINLDRRIRDMIQLSTGELVIWDDFKHLIFIRDEFATAESPLGSDTFSISGYDGIRVREAAVLETNRDAWAAGGFNVHCAGCHAIDDGPSSGPTLAGLFDRGVGNLERYPYSPGLADAGGRWTEDRLAKFMMNPESIAPGSSMPAINLDQWEARAIATYIKENAVEIEEE